MKQEITCSTSLQDVNKLQDRVDIAKADTEDALRRIGGSTSELEDTLNTLKGKTLTDSVSLETSDSPEADSSSSSTGFDQQIDSSRARADTAIQRLPGISATIQQAVRNNNETLSVLGDVSSDYDRALGAVNVLENMVNGLEVTTNHQHIRRGTFLIGLLVQIALCRLSSGDHQIAAFPQCSAGSKHQNEGGHKGSEDECRGRSCRPGLRTGRRQEAGKGGSAGEPSTNESQGVPKCWT